MSEALYRKWRPHLWEEVVGQEHVVRTIQNTIRSQRIGHAYLFAGPRGTGKTTTARLLAKAVNCLSEEPASRPCDHCEHCIAVNENRFLDLIEIDAASNTSVDDVRDLRDKINFSPSQGKYKIYIIDEVHMLSTAAFNALLKTLEEPPAHAIFILATTEIQKIPATVLSRCQRHEFRRIPVADIIAQLSNIVDRENLQVDTEALTLIARQATGSLRDAISLLDQLASTGEVISLKVAQTVLGTTTSQMVIDLVAAILERQAARGMQCIHKTLDSGSDPRQFARQVVEYLRGLLLIKTGNADQVDATQEIHAQMAQHAQACDTERLLNIIRSFNNAAAESRNSWHPGLLLELALTEAVREEKPFALSPGMPASPPPSLTEHSPAAVKPQQQVKPADNPPHQTPPATQAVPNSPQPVVVKTVQPTQPAQRTANLQSIIQNWRNIRALVKKSMPQTDGLLNSCKPLSLKDGLLVLGFQSDVVKSKMEADKHVELTRQAISQILGLNINIQCMVISGKAGIDPANLETEGGGMVDEALNLGGQIVYKE